MLMTGSKLNHFFISYLYHHYEVNIYCINYLEYLFVALFKGSEIYSDQYLVIVVENSPPPPALSVRMSSTSSGLS